MVTTAPHHLAPKVKLVSLHMKTVKIHHLQVSFVHEHFPFFSLSDVELN